jgi:hypothetical protein
MRSPWAPRQLVLPFNDDGLGVISFLAHGQLHEMPARRARRRGHPPERTLSACRIGWIEDGVAIVEPTAE